MGILVGDGGRGEERERVDGLARTKDERVERLLSLLGRLSPVTARLLRRPLPPLPLAI